MATQKQSPAALERVVDSESAEKALERADAKELHVLFERAQQRYTDMDDALTKVVQHFVGEKEVPRYAPSNDNAIAAMAQIASEALALARFVVSHVSESKKDETI